MNIKYIFFGICYVLCNLTSQSQIDCEEYDVIIVDCECEFLDSVTYTVFYTDIDEINCVITEDCFCECLNDSDGDGICDENEIVCVDELQIDEDVLCTSQYDPVCGCDSITYSNECYAFNYGGVTSWTEGECATQCVDESQIDEEVFCTEEYAPVCGCDSITYSNECHAFNYGGVTLWTEGECESTSISNELEGLSVLIYPNPASTNLTVDLGVLNGTETVIKLYDSSGNMMIKKRSVSNLLIEVSSLAQGFYILELSTSNQVRRNRIVIQ